MDSRAANEATPQRPQHRRNASSKSGILRSLISSRPQANASTTQSAKGDRTVDSTKDGNSTVSVKPLGERHSNAQSPPSSPSKKRHQSMAVKPSTTSETPQPFRNSAKEENKVPKKTKSSTNLTSVFAKLNRSSKDVSPQKTQDKENTSPPCSSQQNTDPPIWAQFATTPALADGSEEANIRDEIARYTPQNYSPGKQRNFQGGFDAPQIRPTLGVRPQSIATSNDLIGAIGRRLSVDRTSFGGRRSEDSAMSQRPRDGTSKPSAYRTSRTAEIISQRKASGSSDDQTGPTKEKLTVAKRGGRVWAAVAALQTKGKEGVPAQEEAPLDPEAVDRAFEAVLDSRNVPEMMRPKMRALTLRVKADFVKQNEAGTSPHGTAMTESHAAATVVPSRNGGSSASKEANRPTSKRARPRSRTFNFSKGDRRSEEASPLKKPRSQSRGRLASTSSNETTGPSAASRGRSSSRSGKAARGATAPADFITYMQKTLDPCQMEVGRMHKLRLLLRNETVAWVDQFLALGGMSEVVGLLHRIMGVEWREEHEDQLLHESLLCLKGLCTTARATAELDQVADDLFPALLAMLFDDEKKGPAEYGTRTIIIAVLFHYLQAAKGITPEALQARSDKILSYLGEPAPTADTAQPLEFVKDMHTPRPYRLWSREIHSVTREVFWIFLHQSNTIPLPSASESSPQASAQVSETTYSTRHFPGARPPVAAAPYVGGVEWEATTYIVAHLDLVNGLIASQPTKSDRDALRTNLNASGFEKTLGSALRTCKEKFYPGVHDGLRNWVAAAEEDGWETRFVREGPSVEEQAASSSPRKMSPEKRKEKPPQIGAVGLGEPPKLDLRFSMGGAEKTEVGENQAIVDDDGWLG